MLSRTPPSIVQALYAKRWLLLGALGALIVIAVTMSWLTYRLIARPISRLADQAGRIAQGDDEASRELAAQFENNRGARTREIARLQLAIGDMASTLQRRAAYLQDFARHVSHEFKTPIASIRGAIEVLQDHAQTMPTEQRDKFFANIAADASRLHRLTEKLMELTQAELVDQPPERVQVKAIVDAVASEFAHLATIKNAGVSDAARVLTIPDALHASLEILFENAVQHGATEITVWSEAGDVELGVWVQDNGEGISANNRAKLFEPFFTTQRDEGGTGLGLTIAAALLGQADARIEIQPGNGPTTFTIRLPRAT